MIQVKCSMCLWVGFVKPLHIWEAHGHKYRQVWICDERKEW